jgi:hypothetical protein
MSVDEQQVNEALRELDEAHRLQRIQRTEYRQRRRVLLESLESLESLEGHAADTGDTVRRAVPSCFVQQMDVLPEASGTGSAKGAATPTDFGAELLAMCAVLLSVIAVIVILYCWFAQS